MQARTRQSAFSFGRQAWPAPAIKPLHPSSAIGTLFFPPQVQPGMPTFSLAQRFAAVLRNGAKLMGVGMFSSFVGVAVTNTLLGLRALLDPTFSPPNKPQNVLQTSAAYGVYMSTSSNLRCVPLDECCLTNASTERAVAVAMRATSRARRVCRVQLGVHEMGVLLACFVIIRRSSCSTAAIGWTTLATIGRCTADHRVMRNASP